MRKFLFLLAFVCTFCFISCSDDSEIPVVDKSPVNNKNLDKQVVKDFDIFSTKSNKIKKKAHEISSDIPTSTVVGYDKVENKGSVKMSIPSNSKLFPTLPSGIYFVEKLLYYKDVKHSVSETFFSMDSEDCGYVPIREDNGEEGIGTIRSYTATDNGTCVTMKTYLLHAVSTLSGQKIDVYSPCRPDEIKWNYILF